VTARTGSTRRTHRVKRYRLGLVDAIEPAANTSVPITVKLPRGALHALRAGARESVEFQLLMPIATNPNVVATARSRC
jgi:hypothetical protein